MSLSAHHPLVTPLLATRHAKIDRQTHRHAHTLIFIVRSLHIFGWLGSRVVSVLDSGAEGPGFKSQSRRCRVTVLGKLLTPSVPLFTKQQNW